MVAIGAGLGRATTRAGDGIPRCGSARRLLIRSSRSWVTIDNQPRLTFFGQIDCRSRSGPQANRRERRATKVVTRPIVFRDGQVVRKRVEIVRSHIRLTSRLSRGRRAKRGGSCKRRTCRRGLEALVRPHGFASATSACMASRGKTFALTRSTAPGFGMTTSQQTRLDHRLRFRVFDGETALWFEQR